MTNCLRISAPMLKLQTPKRRALRIRQVIVTIGAIERTMLVNVTRVPLTRATSANEMPVRKRTRNNAKKDFVSAMAVQPMLTK
jgi:hypothetical protein